MNKKRIVAVALSALLLVQLFAVSVFAATGDVKVSLGADLTAEQRAEVLSLLSLSEEDLAEIEVIYVTNEEEHEYLDSYIESDKIGDTALSSSKIVLQDSGYGIEVTTYNINYCTVGMYKNALLTAGVEDAEVYVAGPEKISGTAALIGIMKAYNEATDDSLDEENIQAATEELAVTSELSSELADSENAEQIIAELKTMLDEISGQDDDTIDETIRDVAANYGETLSDESVATIRELLKTLSTLDIDALVDKARELFSSIGELAESVEGLKGILNSIGNFFSNLFSSIADWFNGLF